MPNLDSKILTEFSEVLNVASYTLDQNRLGSEILDTICRCFNIEMGGFRILSDNGGSTVTVHKNTDLEWNNLYKNHFHKFSPFRDLYGKPGGKQVIKLEDVIDPDSFFSSEFYNDFYKPQNIFHKIFIKLEAKGRSIGEICLCRSAGSREFSNQEIFLLRTLSDYVSYAFEHNNLIRKTRLNDSLIKIIEDQWDKGIIILDDNLKISFVNRKGKEFCRNINGNPSIPPVLLEGCHSIKRDLNKGVSDSHILPRHLALEYNSAKISIYTQLIDRVISLEGTRSFMITIEELNGSATLDNKELKACFHLTEREIDIVMNVFKGLKNSEIAENLFVSEITVKKHIQNIFEKVGVKNRTALVNRVLNPDTYSIH